MMADCNLCGATGKLTLLRGLLMDARLRESFRSERCPRCVGGRVAQNPRRDGWAKEQGRLRNLYLAAK